MKIRSSILLMALLGPLGALGASPPVDASGVARCGPSAVAESDGSCQCVALAQSGGGSGFELPLSGFRFGTTVRFDCSAVAVGLCHGWETVGGRCALYPGGRLAKAKAALWPSRPSRRRL